MGIEVLRLEETWYPKKLEPQSIVVELYNNNDSKTSDVAFSVDGAIFRAHKTILSLRCQYLYDAAQEFETTNIDSIPIDGVGAGIFQSLLEFVYTVKVPKINNEKSARELLVASDRFNCVPLKLYAESVIVDKFLNNQNTAALLVSADSLSCPLLKEAAIHRFLLDPNSVKEAREDWLRVEESHRLLKELIDAYSYTASSSDTEENSFETMDVASLRKNLEEAN